MVAGCNLLEKVLQVTSSVPTVAFGGWAREAGMGGEAGIGADTVMVSRQLGRHSLRGLLPLNCSCVSC